MSVRALGEFRGRQTLYRDQFPEVLETVRRVAIVQSTASSNRIEGITVPVHRLEAIVARKSKPKNRSEQEVAGYRDVLSEIHANFAKHRLSPELVLRWHKQMFRYTTELAGIWKKEDNAIIGAIQRLPEEFSFSDLQRLCPGVSFATLRRALQDLKRKKMMVPLGKGRDARWKRLVSSNH